MKITILDTNLDSNIRYDADKIKKRMKEEKKIILLKNRTNEENLDDLVYDNIIGFVENIFLYKGAFRGELVIDPINKKEYTKLIEEHLKKNRIHIALKVDGFRKDDIIVVDDIKQIFYLYLK